MDSAFYEGNFSNLLRPCSYRENVFRTIYCYINGKFNKSNRLNSKNNK